MSSPITPITHSNNSYNSGGSIPPVQQTATEFGQKVVVVAGAGLILLTGSRLASRGPQALRISRQLYSKFRPIKNTPALKPQALFKNTPPKALKEFIRKAQTTDLNNIVETVEKLPIKPIWRQTAIDQATKLQQLRKTQRIEKSVEKLFPKYFKRVVLTLTGIAAGTYEHLSNSDKSKKGTVDTKINIYIDQTKEEGRQIETDRAARAQKMEFDKRNLVNQIMDLIAKLPEDKQLMIKQDMTEVLQNLATTQAEEEAVIFTSLQYFADLKHRPVSSINSELKDYGSYLTASFIELGIALTFNRLPLAKAIIGSVVATGISQAFVERMISGLLIVGMKEGVLIATNQNVTKKELKLATHDVLRQLDIDPAHLEDLDPEEKAFNRHLAYAAVNIIGRTISTIAGNDLLADLIEVSATAVNQLSIEKHLQQYVVHDSLDQKLQQHLAPTERAKQIFKERIEATYDAPIQVLTKVKEDLEKKVVEIEARNRQIQAQTQAAAEANIGSYTVTTWISKKLSWVPSLSSLFGQILAD